MLGYEKEKENLLKAEIKKGHWIDAGCGHGAYSIPLSQLVDFVTAIDINRKALEHLQKVINKSHISNINLIQGDIRELDNYKLIDIEGILFAFSLHYQKDLEFLLNLITKIGNKQLRIVIIEYTRTTPVSWVPYPYPPQKLMNLLNKNDSLELGLRFQNNRYYILTADTK